MTLYQLLNLFAIRSGKKKWYNFFFCSEIGSKFHTEVNMKLRRKTEIVLSCEMQSKNLQFVFFYSQLEKSYFTAHFTFII